MAYVTQHGFLWGAVPETTGSVYWVSPSDSYTIAGITYYASNENDGRSPERALRTVARAWALVAATSGDVIVLLPGTHTVTATVSMATAGVTMMGLPRYKQNISRLLTTLTISASADILNYTASNIEIAYLHFIPVTTMDSISHGVLATGMHIHHCSVDLDTAAANTATKGFNLAPNTSLQAFNYVHDCAFYCDSAQGAGLDFGTTTACGGASLVERCTFIQSTGTWAAALRYGASADAGRGTLIRRCDFIAATDATMTAGILGGAGTEETAHVHYCYFSDTVTKAVDTYGARGCELAENYQAGVGATDGGILVVDIT